MEIINILVELINNIIEALRISENGHVEHFIVGGLIGGLISHLYFDKTHHILKSIFLGVSTAFFVGLLKEYADPLIGGDKNKLDLIYTFLGSIIGVTLFLLNTYFQKKRI